MLVSHGSDRTGLGHVLTREKYTNIRCLASNETRKDYTHVKIIRQNIITRNMLDAYNQVKVTRDQQALMESLWNK